MHVDKPQCFWENIVWTYETKWKPFGDTVTSALCSQKKAHEGGDFAAKGPRMNEKKTLEHSEVAALHPDLNTKCGTSAERCSDYLQNVVLHKHLGKGPNIYDHSIMICCISIIRKVTSN